ncbi:MAG: YwqG family protein [Erythrobacter sp.]
MRKIGLLTASLLASLLGQQPALADEPIGKYETSQAIARFAEWQDANQLPALELAPAGDPARTPGGSRIGGPVWLPEGESWPLDAAGKRLTFLAQIDFAAMPPLPDYPTSGVLQFFIGRDDLYGANFEDPQQGSFKVIYRQSTDGPGRLETGPVTEGQRYVDDFSPLEPEFALKGVALTAQPIMHRPTIDVWQFSEDLGRHLGDAGLDAIYDYLNAADTGPKGGWRVGGHPGYTQSDWRYDSEFRNVDRVLLQLWTSDDILMWGDSGQGQFMIRREDLLKRDFSKVFYQWDCY